MSIAYPLYMYMYRGCVIWTLRSWEEYTDPGELSFMYSLWATLGWLLYEHSIHFIHVHVSGALLGVFHYNILNTIISNVRAYLHTSA